MASKASNDKSVKNPLFQYDAKLPLREVVPLGLQHLAAAIVGIVTPAIMIAEMCGLDDNSKTILVQMSLVLSGLITLLQLFPIFRIGAKLPVIIGTSFAYLSTMQGIVSDYILTNPDDSMGAVAVILGSQIFGGIAAFLVGLFLKQIRKFFPPIVTGTVIFTIGLSLYPTAVRYMAGGAGSEYFGCWQAWSVALFTLLVVIFFNYFTKGFCKLASILLGIIAGYVLALIYSVTGIAQLVDLSSVGESSWFQIITPMHFGIKFVPTAIISMVIMYVVNAVQAIGDFTSTTMGGMDREPTSKELSGGIMANGLAGILGAFFGGFSLATYSQNVGIVTLTRVINRMVFAFAAIVLIIAGIFPKFAALLTTIPVCVLGGATISVFASITMTGIRTIASAGMSQRNLGIVGLAVALGVGVTQVSDVFSGFPSWVSSVFGSSSIVIATLAAIILNIALPKEKDKVKK